MAVYIPAGVAHGFQSLADASEVFYQIAERYMPEADPRASAGTIRRSRIDWPIRPPILSDRDAGYPDFRATTGSLPA